MGRRSSFLEFEIMRHVPIVCVVLLILISPGTVGFAQSPPLKPRYPGEIAAVSNLLAEKNEICRRQARKLKLHFLKRHRFMRDCVKKKH
jgi:hypothetical protein